MGKTRPDLLEWPVRIEVLDHSFVLPDHAESIHPHAPFAGSRPEGSDLADALVAKVAPCFWLVGIDAVTQADIEAGRE
jgi:hypothetical protein